MGTCRRQISLPNPASSREVERILFPSRQKYQPQREVARIVVYQEISLSHVCSNACIKPIVVYGFCLQRWGFFCVRCSLHQCVLFANQARTLSNFQDISRCLPVEPHGHILSVFLGPLQNTERIRNLSCLILS